MKFFYLLLLLFLSNLIYGQHPLMSALDSSVYPQFVAVQNGVWHNPNTWDTGVVPTDNATVMIPANRQVTISTELEARHKFIHVDGNLFIAINNNTALKVETLFVGEQGYFRIGLPNNRVNPTKTAQITFISDDQPIDRSWDTAQVTRGMMTMGLVRAYGQIKTHMLEFKQDLVAGQSSITFTNETIPSDWETGDKLVIAGTSFERVQDSFEDEELTIANISGNTIQFETPVQYDHIRLREDQSLHFAHLTRNIIFKSESTDLINQRRAHMMFMRPNVDIEHAAIIGLGRTDKSKPLDEIIVDVDNNIITTGPRNNVRGRYAIHFHKNGYAADVNSAPSNILGCVVQNTQGWGFVNHSSHVNFEENVCHDFVGSAFVTESGDELGNFTNNIAIKGTGDGVYLPSRMVFNNAERPLPLSDFAFGGDGFWFQGPAVRAVNNVAANCNGSGMIWMTFGSVEIDDNEIIGLDTTIAKQVYAAHPDIANWEPRRWKHAENEALLSDLPILECSGFTGYANLSGFRIRMNNHPTISIIVGGFDFRFPYNEDIIGLKANPNNRSTALRLDQSLSDLELWNNETGLRTRYSSQTTLSNVTIDNGLRHFNIRNPFPAAETLNQLFDYNYVNTNVSNYAVGLWFYRNQDHIDEDDVTFESGTITNVGNDHYDLDTIICQEPNSITVSQLSHNSATINIAESTDLQTLLVRYKSDQDHYWHYRSIDQSNSIELKDLYPEAHYDYQVLVGCEFSPSRWSEEKSFLTLCSDFEGGYWTGSNWNYGTFTAPACIGDLLRIRLRTARDEGSTVYTKPNGEVQNGSVFNTLFISPVEPDDFGIYSVEYTDDSGCVSHYSFEVLPNNPKEGGFTTETLWNYGTFDAIACVGDRLRIRLRTARNEGSTVYTKPNGEVQNGSVFNTLFIDPVEPEDFGTYTAEYTDAEGCVAIYHFTVTPESQKEGGFTTETRWNYGTFDAVASVGDFLRLRLRTANNEGSTLYTTPTGDVLNGSTLNTLFINPVGPEDFGIYTADYTDANGCVGRYYFTVMPADQSQNFDSQIPDASLTNIVSNFIETPESDEEIRSLVSDEYTLYPNPVSDNTLLISGEKIERVEIFSLTGKQISVQNFIDQKTPVKINCSDFNAGIYFARINSKKALKFIVQR